ncbi:MAG: YbaN family protein [Dehalococcoidia bacterium]|nr:YbaN family protein [Dehalococcoidia bacterium]
MTLASEHLDGSLPPPAPATHPQEAVHSAHVARVTENRLARVAWGTGGTFSLGMGVVGIVVPGWPTTIFLIIAAACYARSSQRMYDRILRIRGFGDHVRRYRETGAMPARAKMFALGIMWPFVLFSVFFAIPSGATWALALTLGLAVIGTIYILRLPLPRDT